MPPPRVAAPEANSKPPSVASSSSPAASAPGPSSNAKQAPREDFFTYHERRQAELTRLAKANDFQRVETELRTLVAEDEAQTPVAIEAVSDRATLAWLRWRDKDDAGALREMEACARAHHDSGMMGNMSVFTGSWEAWLEAFFLRERAASQSGSQAAATLARAEKARAAHEKEALNIGKQLDATLLRLHYAVRRSARAEVAKILADPSLLNDEDEEPEHLYVVARAFQLVKDEERYRAVRARLEKTDDSIIKAIMLAVMPLRLASPAAD